MLLFVEIQQLLTICACIDDSKNIQRPARLHVTVLSLFF